MFASLRGDLGGGQRRCGGAPTIQPIINAVLALHTADPRCCRTCHPAGMTIEQIVAAIRALSVPERLRVIELVAHDAANDAPVADAEATAQGGAILTERHGLLLVDACEG